MFRQDLLVVGTGHVRLSPGDFSRMLVRGAGAAPGFGGTRGPPGSERSGTGGTPVGARWRAGGNLSGGGGHPGVDAPTDGVSPNP
ncbi:hypothetical protein GCM10010249_35070 [Streptomyces roseolilacinus]|uniref:Uncharacterized protein n=1 Tax=Streptomyces roseolilacinus TaxID=66904 RepID=A0A918B117_9ACTN|nr:hypothetical protein GCM10010249_35070 [Streptomyces roseolilacinus]